ASGRKGLLQHGRVRRRAGAGRHPLHQWALAGARRLGERHDALPRLLQGWRAARIALGRDPEKGAPVFGQDHAQSKKSRESDRTLSDQTLVRDLFGKDHAQFRKATSLARLSSNQVLAVPLGLLRILVQRDRLLLGLRLRARNDAVV